MSDLKPHFIVIESENDAVVIENDVEVVEVAQRGPPGPVGTTNPKEFTVEFDADESVVDWEGGDIARLTLTGDTTISMIGTRKKCLLILTQDATGGHLVTWDTDSVGFGTDIPFVPLSSAPSKTDYLGFAYNLTTGKQDLVAYSRGY